LMGWAFVALKEMITHAARIVKPFETESVMTEDSKQSPKNTTRTKVDNDVSTFAQVLKTSTDQN
jgi:hypothetical protein